MFLYQIGVWTKISCQLTGYASVNSKPDHPPPPGDPRGFAHSNCPWGRVFAPLSCPEVCPRGVLNQSKSLIILEESMIFALSLKQMSSSSFHMFIYARSEPCDLGPIYATGKYAAYQNLSR